jgi:hypothetical protein
MDVSRTEVQSYRYTNLLDAMMNAYESSNWTALMKNILGKSVSNLGPH